jgi:hypothetical protein
MSDYIDWVAANTLKFEAIELKIGGETDDEKCASLVAEMIRHELCVED